MKTSKRICGITLEELVASAKKWRKKMYEVACPELKNLSEDEFKEMQERLTKPILTIEETKHFASLGEINIKRYQTKNGNETDNQ